MFIWCDGVIDGFELVWDSIGREGIEGDIIGGQAAPAGVATQYIFGYGEGGGGCIVLCLFVCDIIWYIIDMWGGELLHNRIDLRGGRGELIGGKTAPHGVVVKIIFI